MGSLCNRRSLCGMKKKSHHPLTPKFSTSLSEGTLSRTPQLPPTTPSIGTNGRNNPYTTLLPPQLPPEDHLNNLHNEQQQQKISLTNPTLLNSSMNSIYKMISKLPYEVRESVTSIVNMAIFNSNNSQKQYEGLKLEHLTLKSQHKKKVLEYQHLQQRCEIFHEQILKLEEKLGALQDDAESRQTYAIRNSKAISRLSSTNKTLIDAFALLTDGHTPSSSLAGGGSNQDVSRGRSSSQRHTQRRKNNLLTDLTSTSRVSSPEDLGSSKPNSPLPGLKHLKGSDVTAGQHNSSQEVSVTKNEKLRERLLRVAKDHNRVVKNVENLELKIQGLRSSLRYAERRNRQLQLELDEIRENQSLENSSYHKNQSDGNDVSSAGTSTGRGSSGGTKNMKDRMDTRLSVLVNRNAFDPMDGIKYMDSMIAHLSTTPCNLIEEDIVKHLCSREACHLFDVEKIAIYILQPGGKIMNRYATNSQRVDKIKLGERESIAENILFHGLIRRFNNLKQSKNLFYNPDIDSVGDVNLKRILSVPLREMGQGGRVIGVCHLLNKRDNHKFSEVDELYVTAYGEMCGGLVSGSILFRRVWNESTIITGIIQASYQLLNAVPRKDTLCSETPLNLIDLLYTLEHVVRDALKCSKVKAFVLSPDQLLSKSSCTLPTMVCSLEQEAITMMTLKTSQLSLRTSSIHSGVVGHVLTSMKPYLVLQSSFDPWLNPEVDMQSTEQPFYCVPIINFQNQVIGCLQLSPSQFSPNINSIQEKIEPLLFSFEKASEWLAYTISGTLWTILQSVGKPTARPEMIQLESITLTEKLATMSLSVQPSQPEAIRKRKQTIVKSVTMAEESSFLPKGGLFDQHPNKSSSTDEDFRDFLLQFPDYEPHQQATAAVRTNTTSQPRISPQNNPQSDTTIANGIESLDTQRTSPISFSGPLISPQEQTNNPNSNKTDPDSSSNTGTALEREQTLKAKYEKEIASIKSELFFVKEKAKSDLQKAQNELKVLREEKTHEDSTQQHLELLQKQQEDEMREMKEQQKLLEDRYENILTEYRQQYEQDLKKIRNEQENEKTVLRKNILQLEEMIQSLQKKLTFVDQPMGDPKHLEIVGHLEVSQISIQDMKSPRAGSSEAILQIKLGDGSNWSHLSNPTPVTANGIIWKQLNFHGKISQAQLPIDTLSLRIKEKRDGAVKLFGIANVNLSSLIIQSNQWVTLSGDLLTEKTNAKAVASQGGRYQIRIRYYREDQTPQRDTEELEIKETSASSVEAVTTPAPAPPVELRGFLEVQEINFGNLKSDLPRKSLFAECHLNSQGNEKEQWLHLTDLEDLPPSSTGPSSEVKWTRLSLTGGVLQSSVESGGMLFFKQQNLPKDLVLGQAPLDLHCLLNQTNEWVDVKGILLDEEGKETGSYLIRLRYRREDQEVHEETEREDRKSTLPVMGEQESKQPIPPPLPTDPAESEEVEAQHDALLDEVEAIEAHLGDHHINEERPPPTPSQEEVTASPRFGSWAQMTDEEGHVFYYHTITGETSWNPPEEVTGEHDGHAPHHVMDEDTAEMGQVRNGDWIQLQDDGGNFYWYNEITGESSWELPSDDPELYVLPMDSHSQGSVGSGTAAAYASASAGGYTIEL